MKIHMVGEASRHRDKLARHLASPCEIVALPREAAFAADLDHTIAAGDVVISLRLRRDGSAMPAMGLLHVPGAGLDGIDLAALPTYTRVCNVFEHEIPIAEFVLAAMLHWEIRLDALRESFSPERWPDVYRNRVPHGEAFGKTLAVIGFGRIGRAIATRARAFGVRIIAVDQHEAPEPADLWLPPAQLDAALAEADYVVLSCPLTDATRGLMGAHEFGRMKRQAVLINVSRAEIANEQALFEALRDGTIGGAILDVWYRYPQGSDDRVEPSRFPFHTLDNTICTPHSSAWTEALTERRYAFIAANINRWRDGQPLQNLVQGPAG